MIHDENSIKRLQSMLASGSINSANAAVTEIFEGWYDTLHRWVRRNFRSLSHEDVEDALSDAFVALQATSQKYPAVFRSTPLPAVIYQHVKTRCLNKVRSNKRHNERIVRLADSLPAGDYVHPNVFSRDEYEALLDRWRRFCRGLSETDRKITSLYFNRMFSGRPSYADIAFLLSQEGVSINEEAVRSRVRRLAARWKDRAVSQTA